MTKWRYRSLVLRDLSIAEPKLTAEGEKGWELVSVCLIDSKTARAFFKMAVSDQEPADAVESGTAVVAAAPSA
ncbi:MAG TPA: hypothetical protein VLH79_16465 [Chthonomonadales bacterium]|nr:hypothetical protein [Chthonomonadales bacterium]